MLLELDITDFNEMFMMNDLPKPRVLSSQVSVRLFIQNFGIQDGVYHSDPTLQIGELDNFTVRKNFTVIKRWKPFGSKYEKILVEDNGWDINFTSSKVDWSLGYMFYENEKSLTGLGESNFNAAGWNEEDWIYSQPIFAIEHSIEHYDGKVENYIYKDFQILSYDQNTPGDNGVLVESVSGFSPQRRAGAGITEIDTTKISDRVIHTISTMIKLNRS